MPPKQGELVFHHQGPSQIGFFAIPIIQVEGANHIPPVGGALREQPVVFVQPQGLLCNVPEGLELVEGREPPDLLKLGRHGFFGEHELNRSHRLLQQDLVTYLLWFKCVGESKSTMLVVMVAVVETKRSQCSLAGFGHQPSRRMNQTKRINQPSVYNVMEKSALAVEPANKYSAMFGKGGVCVDVSACSRLHGVGRPKDES